MSDLYDSLEDDDDDEGAKCSSDSLDYSETRASNFGRRILRRKPTTLLHVGGNSAEEPKNETVTKSIYRKSSALPKIKNCFERKGSKKVPQHILVDAEALNKQGLQLNKDGSFTKSPRKELEELPFVTREYRNLQFQKKKTYELRQRGPYAKTNRKNVFTFKKNSENEISMVEIINARGKKNSSEEMLTSGGSSFTETVSKSSKTFVAANNLTDSMKEKLLNNKNCDSSKRCNQVLDQLKKGVRKNSNSKQTLPTNVPHPEKEEIRTREWKHRFRSAEEKKDSKTVDDDEIGGFPESKGDVVAVATPMRRRQSDVLLRCLKPRLTYLELEQKKSGFHPAYLRHGKGVPTDTDRSTFGDSVAERLSNLSSRITTSREITDDEDEELFYKKVMEKEGKQDVEASCSSRSDEFFGQKKRSTLVGTKSCQDTKEFGCNLSNYSRCKNNTKSTSIDMPGEDSHSVRPLKKCSHYCSPNMIPTVSKTELALRGKAYGYIANARNIFKLKIQSESKSNPKKIEYETFFPEKNSNSKNVSSDRRTTVTKENKYFVDAALEQMPRQKTSFFPPKLEKLCASAKNPSSFILPPFTSSERKESEFRTEILKRMTSCLNSSMN